MNQVLSGATRRGAGEEAGGAGRQEDHGRLPRPAPPARRPPDGFGARPAGAVLIAGEGRARDTGRNGVDPHGGLAEPGGRGPHPPGRRGLGRRCGGPDRAARRRGRGEDAKLPPPSAAVRQPQAGRTARFSATTRFSTTARFRFSTTARFSTTVRFSTTTRSSPFAVGAGSPLPPHQPGQLQHLGRVPWLRQRRPGRGCSSRPGLRNTITASAHLHRQTPPRVRQHAAAVYALWPLPAAVARRAHPVTSGTVSRVPSVRSFRPGSSWNRWSARGGGTTSLIRHGSGRTANSAAARAGTSGSCAGAVCPVNGRWLPR